VDQINLFKLIQYIQDSKLAYKIEGYAVHVTDSGGQKVPDSSILTPVLHTLTSFVICLTNLGSEGRIFYEKIPGEIFNIQLSYLLLSPTHVFSSVVSSARAVILAGGTMSPFDDYKDHLFPALKDNKVTTLSCGHVIPASSICVWTLGKAKTSSAIGSDSTFEFSFQRRRDRGMINQLGLAILNISAVVPDGMVIFFPSYSYLDEVVAIWEEKTSDAPKSIWERLQGRKQLFKETKDASSDAVLEEYSKAILSDEAEGGTGRSTSRPRSKVGGGAMLFSVVGGKMSEGINFSDRLGRCVIIIGLPYPNINSPEWKAKMEYIESVTMARLLGDQPETVSSAARGEAVATAKQTARDFYENACMRAVNQSIGRAIRHRNDYAAIILADRRYGTSRIRRKLPGWIQGGLAMDSHEKELPQLMGALSGFFRSKRTT
jgi:chromosome transmission fidelity protein 1